MLPLPTVRPVRVFFLLVVACLVTGAGGLHADRPLVVAGNALVGEWARAVGGEAVEVRVLAPAGGFHAHEPSPGDLRLLADADLVLAFGLGLDPWLPRLAQASGGRAPVVPVAETLRTIPGALIPAGDPAHASCGHEGCTATHGDVDPHVWLDPELAAAIVRGLAGHLAGVAPAEAESLRARALAEAARIAALDAELRAALEAVPAERRRFVTHHGAFAYLARHYGFAEPASLLGSLSTEADEPGARALAGLVRTIRTSGAVAVFAEAGHDDRLARRVAAEAGVSWGLLHAEALPPEDPTYAGLVRANARELRRVLAPGS